MIIILNYNNLTVSITEDWRKSCKLAVAKQNQSNLDFNPVITVNVDNIHEIYNIFCQRNRMTGDITLCFITYTLLALDKRFSEYETMGEVFGVHRNDLMALTLWRRILAMIEAILQALADVISIDLDELAEKILNNEHAAKKYEIMLRALQKCERAA